MKFGKSVRLTTMLVLTGSFFLVELVVGYMSNSMALVADSFHMLSDVLALIIGLFSVRIARRKSAKNTFGWARAEILGALVNAVFLCALCFSIFIESIQRFTDPGLTITQPELVLYVGIVGLVVNILGLFLFHDHGHGHGHGGHDHGHSHGHAHGSHSHKHEHEHEHEHGSSEHVHDHGHDHSQQSDSQDPQTSTTIAIENSDVVVHDADKTKHKVVSSSQMNMHGVFLHVAGDALGSVVVIIAALVISYTELPYKHYIDPAMSLFSVVVILGMTIPLLRSSALILLQTVPLHIKARDVQTRLEKLEGVLAVHELHIWQLAGNRIVGSAHIWCKNYAEYKRSASRIKEFFHNEGIHSITIQPEFEDFDENNSLSLQLSRSPTYCMLACPEEKQCSENMCCKPDRSTRPTPAATRRHSDETGGGHAHRHADLELALTRTLDQGCQLEKGHGHDNEAFVDGMGAGPSFELPTNASTMESSEQPQNIVSRRNSDSFTTM